MKIKWDSTSPRNKSKSPIQKPAEKTERINTVDVYKTALNTMKSLDDIKKKMSNMKSSIKPPANYKYFKKEVNTTNKLNDMSKTIKKMA